MYRTSAVALASVVAMAGMNGVVHSADDWPEGGPITIVVPYSPGAGNDLLGRMTADYLTDALGQQVSVENRPGAGSMIGLESVASADPDGYELLWSPSDGMTILPAVREQTPYTVPDDFDFLARIVQLGFVIAVHPDLPIDNIDDLIEYSEERPGGFRYGSSGTGGAPHMGAMLLGDELGLDWTHVPYQGLSVAIGDLIGGHTDMVWITPPTAFEHYQEGTIKVIAQTGEERHPFYEDVPTLQEEGIDLTLGVFYGMMAPAGTPDHITDTLQTEIGAMLEDEEIVEYLNDLGYTPAFMPGDEFEQFVVDELAGWQAAADAAGISLED